MKSEQSTRTSWKSGTRGDQIIESAIREYLELNLFTLTKPKAATIAEGDTVNAADHAGAAQNALRLLGYSLAYADRGEIEVRPIPEGAMESAKAVEARQG